MSYGLLTDEQEAAVKAFVEGQIVHDLGAGDLVLAHRLANFGASHVVAIDKEHRPPGRMPRGKVTYKQAYFHELKGPYRTIFLSWPQNLESPDLALLALQAETLIYLGKNTDGTMCGSPSLFEVMIRRELLTYIPSKGNTLIITGKQLDDPRLPTPEERAGLTAMTSGILAYESIENASEASP